MKKQITCLIAFICLFMPLCFAHPNHKEYAAGKQPSQKQIKNFDALLDSRLHLTKEQKELLKQNRAKRHKDMKKVVSRMQELKEKIRNVYLTGIPPFQAELRTAPYKAELVILKQKINIIREERRIEFENTLNQEQKIEFEKFKKELAQKRLETKNNKKESP